MHVLLDRDIRSYQDPNILRVRRGHAVTIEDDEVAAVMDNGSLTEPSEISLFNETHERRDGTGESRRTLSWIWTTSTSQNDVHKPLDEILRSEWAKSRARATRTKEEILLLKEEMC